MNKRPAAQVLRIGGLRATEAFSLSKISGELAHKILVDMDWGIDSLIHNVDGQRGWRDRVSFNYGPRLLVAQIIYRCAVDDDEVAAACEKDAEQILDFVQNILIQIDSTKNEEKKKDDANQQRGGNQQRQGGNRQGGGNNP